MDVSARTVVFSPTGHLARRWYYTPQSRRAYSVRPLAPGDRRMLVEFVAQLTGAAPEDDIAELHGLGRRVLDTAFSPGPDAAVGFVALESSAGGDRVVGVATYAPSNQERADVSIAVADGIRREGVGSILMAMLIRQARRTGVRQLAGSMHGSNCAMRRLAISTGFVVDTLHDGQTHRPLLLQLR